jgi:hypothetical protein
VRVLPQGVQGPKRVKTHAQIQKQKLEEIKIKRRIKDCKQKKDDMMVKLSKKEDSNQKIQIANQIKIL